MIDGNDIATQRRKLRDRKWKSLSRVQLFVTHGLHPWDSPGQNTGVGSLSLLQRIFPTQKLNPGLLHCRQIRYQLSHKGSLRILEWIAYPFSSRASQPRNRTGVSCIAGRFFSNWVIRKTEGFSKAISLLISYLLGNYYCQSPISTDPRE